MVDALEIYEILEFAGRAIKVHSQRSRAAAG
jgi:hypothetical protein